MRTLRHMFVAPFLLLLSLSVFVDFPAEAALKDRIAEVADQANLVPMAGTLHPLAQNEFDQGLTDNAKVLSGMSMNFNRSAAQEADLQGLLQGQQNPASANYHKWLTPAQFGARFGMSSADLAKASAWLQQQGFTVTSVSQSNNSISFSGSVASVERAFETKIHNYSVDGEMHFANATQISLPSAFAGSVSSIRGLNDFRLKPRVKLSRTRAHPILTLPPV